MIGAAIVSFIFAWKRYRRKTRSADEDSNQEMRDEINSPVIHSSPYPQQRYTVETSQENDDLPSNSQQPPQYAEVIGNGQEEQPPSYDNRKNFPLRSQLPTSHQNRAYEDESIPTQHQNNNESGSAGSPEELNDQTSSEGQPTVFLDSEVPSSNFIFISSEV